MKFRYLLEINLILLGGLTLLAPQSSAQLVVLENQQFITQETPGVPGLSGEADHMGATNVAGDFNNDGFSDLVIGIPLEIVEYATVEDGVPVTNLVQSGRVVVMYGSTTGLNQTNVATQSWSEASEGVPGVPVDHEIFGIALAVGDFNGDAYEDLAIGAPRPDSRTEVLPRGGEVVILHGGPGGLTTEGSQLWRQGENELLGQDEDSDLFGFSMTANDFNGDGFGDLAIGIPFEGLGAVDNAGALSILYGSNAGLSAANNQFLTEAELGDPLNANQWLGVKMDSGDFNNDGFPDLAALALFGEPGVYLVPGSSAGLDPGRAILVPIIVDPNQDNYSLSAGDFNSDGFADLALGAPYQPVPGPHLGSVTVFRGAAGIFTGLGASNLDAFTIGSFGIEAAGSGELGAGLASGDFNRDGFVDLAASMPALAGGPESLFQGGAVVLVEGNAFGNLILGSNIQVLQQGVDGVMDESEVGDSLGGYGGAVGSHTLTAGDFNGDGFADLVIGVPLESLVLPDVGSVRQSGAVHVLYGGRDFSGTLNKATQDLQGVLDNLSRIPIQ